MCIRDRAYSHQISAGPAKILTVIDGQEIKPYDIEIQRLLPGRTDGKNMIIEVTDPELLEKTGGTVSYTHLDVYKRQT